MLKKAGDKLFGYAGKLLHVDLSKGSFEEHEHLRRKDLDQMLDGYYAVRGWNLDGKPTKTKLEELGITKLFGR